MCPECTWQKHNRIGMAYPSSVSTNRKFLCRTREDVSTTTHTPGIFFSLNKDPIHYLLDSGSNICRWIKCLEMVVKSM